MAYRQANYVQTENGLWVPMKCSDAGEVFTQPKGRNEQIFDGTATWAESAAAGTEVSVDIALPSILQGDALYLVIVTNPSTVTAVTVAVRNKETFDVARYPELASFNIPVNTPEGKAVLVQGWMLGEAGRLTLSNDTALGLGEGFTAYIRVRKV